MYMYIYICIHIHIYTYTYMYMDTYIHISILSPNLLVSRLLQHFEKYSLFYTVGPCCLYILYIAMCTFIFLLKAIVMPYSIYQGTWYVEANP